MGKARMSLSRLAAVWFLRRGGITDHEALSHATGLGLDDVKGATKAKCAAARTKYDSITLARPVRCDTCASHPLICTLPCQTCKPRKQRYSMNRWEQTQEPVTLGRIGLHVYSSRPWRD